KAAEVAPRAIQPRHRLAIAKSERGDVDGAVKVLEEAIALDPRDVFALHALGGLYARKGDFERADKFQAEVLRIEPTHKAARFALANSMIDRGHAEQAERELAKLYQQDGRALAEYGFARLAAKRGQWADVAARLHKVLETGVTRPDKILTDAVFRDGWTKP